MSEISEEKKCSGDSCLWLCFPCLFTWMICEKGLQSCCICLCCMYNKEQISDEVDTVKLDSIELHE